MPGILKSWKEQMKKDTTTETCFEVNKFWRNIADGELRIQIDDLEAWMLKYDGPLIVAFPTNHVDELPLIKQVVSEILGADPRQHLVSQRLLVEKCDLDPYQIFFWSIG